MSYEVRLTEEVIDFILSVPVKMQAKIQRTINLLEEFGYQLPEPHSKKIKGIEHLHELRIKFASDIVRLFYFHWKDQIYVITSGYVKKSNKTDRLEIEKAKIIQNNFME